MVVDPDSYEQKLRGESVFSGPALLLIAVGVVLSLMSFAAERMMGTRLLGPMGSIFVGLGFVLAGLRQRKLGVEESGFAAKSAGAKIILGALLLVSSAVLIAVRGMNAPPKKEMDMEMELDLKMDNINIPVDDFEPPPASTP